MAEPDYVGLGRRGGLTTAATRDMRQVAAHARRSAPSSVEYFYDQVDKARTLDKSDRERRARAAQRRYFSDLAGKRKRKQNGDENVMKAGPREPTSTVTADHDEMPRHESGPA